MGCSPFRASVEGPGSQGPGWEASSRKLVSSEGPLPGRGDGHREVGGQGRIPQKGTFGLSTGCKWAEGSCPTTTLHPGSTGLALPLTFTTGQVPCKCDLCWHPSRGRHHSLWLSHHCWVLWGGKGRSTSLGGGTRQEKEEISHSSHELSKGAGLVCAPLVWGGRSYEGLSCVAGVTGPLLAECFLQGRSCPELCQVTPSWPCPPHS